MTRDPFLLFPTQVPPGSVFRGYDPAGNEIWELPGGVAPLNKVSILEPETQSLFCAFVNGQTFSLTLKKGTLDVEGDMPLSDAAKSFIGMVLQFAPKVALEKLSATDAWQPIATAPKDGTTIVGMVRQSDEWDRHYIVFYRNGGFVLQDDHHIGVPDLTHWKPL